MINLEGFLKERLTEYGVPLNIFDLSALNFNLVGVVFPVPQQGTVTDFLRIAGETCGFELIELNGKATARLL